MSAIAHYDAVDIGERLAGVRDRRCLAGWGVAASCALAIAAILYTLAVTS